MSLQLYLALLMLLMISNIHCSCQRVFSSLFFPGAFLYIFWKDTTFLFRTPGLWYYLFFVTFHLILIFSVYSTLPTYSFNSNSVLSTLSHLTVDINTRVLQIHFYLQYVNLQVLDTCHIKGTAFVSNKGKLSHNSTNFSLQKKSKAMKRGEKKTHPKHKITVTDVADFNNTVIKF